MFKMTICLSLVHPLCLLILREFRPFQTVPETNMVTETTEPYSNAPYNRALSTPCVLRLESYVRPVIATLDYLNVEKDTKNDEKTVYYLHGHYQNNLLLPNQ